MQIQASRGQARHDDNFLDEQRSQMLGLGGLAGHVVTNGIGFLGADWAFDRSLERRRVQAVSTYIFVDYHELYFHVVSLDTVNNDSVVKSWERNPRTHGSECSFACWLVQGVTSGLVNQRRDRRHVKPTEAKAKKKPTLGVLSVGLVGVSAHLLSPRATLIWLWHDPAGRFLAAHRGTD
jgi:hypothetical protein